MHLRRCTQVKNGKQYCYWQLVESVRTTRGPRQRVVAYLGDAPESKRKGVEAVARHGDAACHFHQLSLCEEAEPEWTQIDTANVRLENSRNFGGPWLGLQIVRKLGLDEFLQAIMPPDRAAIEWWAMSLVLVLSRLCDPSSELHIAEHSFARSGLSDLLGVPAQRVNDDRLYRALDHLLPHKEELEAHLKGKLGELFDLSYDLLLYDMTSTYFEGAAARNPQAQRGYSRDHRGDCKQVTIALVVTRDGLPLGYQVFDGNTADVTTVRTVVERIEALYGRAERIWVMDRGMVSQDNINWLREGCRRYIVGTPKTMLRKFEQRLLDQEWSQIVDGLEVKLCPPPKDLLEGAAGAVAEDELFVLCRSRQRQEKERAMRERFSQRIEAGLEDIVESCTRRKQTTTAVAVRVGRLLGRNTRAESLYEVEITAGPDGAAQVTWQRRNSRLDWAQLTEGCYLLRTNITDWKPEELWQAYIQLTHAETAFRIHKQDLSMRPIWHQQAERVQAHVLVCFLAYVLWKTLAMLCHHAGLGDEPRKVLAEISEIRTADVVMRMRDGVELRRRCVIRPDGHQLELLARLGLRLPSSLRIAEM